MSALNYMLMGSGWVREAGSTLRMSLGFSRRLPTFRISTDSIETSQALASSSRLRCRLNDSCLLNLDLVPVFDRQAGYAFELAHVMSGKRCAMGKAGGRYEQIVAPDGKPLLFQVSAGVPVDSCAG